MLKRGFLYVMALAYVAAGINHFLNPDLYLKIIPRFLPWHSVVNVITGILEVIFGLLLLSTATRSAAAWGLAGLLILIFPANVQMAVDYAAQDHPQKWLTYLRLPLQPALVWWAVSYTRWYKNRKSKPPSFPGITLPN